MSLHDSSTLAQGEMCSNIQTLKKTATKHPLSCLFLSSDVIRFEAVSEVTAVFFDESNSQLIISRSNGAGGIVVKSKKDKNLLNLRLPNLGDIGSLNFSPDSRILAIKRTTSRSIDFTSVYPGYEAKEFSQTSKLKGSKMIGVGWVRDDEVVMVTDKGVEYYQIFAEKKSLRLLKHLNVNVNWYLWMRESGVCMLSTGSLTNIFYALLFKDSTFSKMSKLEIEMTSTSRPLKQKDFMLVQVYGTTYMTRIIVEKVNCLVEVHLYPIRRESSSKTASEALLLLNYSGRVVLSVVDNLIILHHHLSKTSHIYDIGLDHYDIRGGVKFHLPIIPSLSIRSFDIQPSCNEMNQDGGNINCELYSSHWAIFNPDVILDAKQGCYWNLKVDLESLVHLVDDKVHLVGILLLRNNSQSLVFKVCHDLIIDIAASSLVDINPVSQIFDKINSMIANQNTSKKDNEEWLEMRGMYDEVFGRLHVSQNLSGKYLNSILLEYLTSLSNHNLLAEDQLNNLLIERLLQQGKGHQLQQLLQYRLFPDSKPLAIRLLSLDTVFPAGNQLGLDMLRRMSTSLECIFELMLSNKQVVSAIRYAHSLGLSEQLKARKFLQEAMSCNDDSIFFVVFTFFSQQNTKHRGAPAFIPMDHCEKYVEYYKQRFCIEEA